jgi:hypothetical protein
VYWSLLESVPPGDSLLTVGADVNYIFTSITTKWYQATPCITSEKDKILLAVNSYCSETIMLRIKTVFDGVPLGIENIWLFKVCEI